MKHQLKFYRYWQYFRLGFSKYLTYPFTLMNFLTITFVYLTERIPSLSIQFSQFILMAIVVAVPLGTVIGWFDMRKSRIHTTEIEVGVQSNPMQIYVQRVLMENTLELYRALDITPSDEWMHLYLYWKKHDKQRWIPT